MKQKAPVVLKHNRLKHQLVSVLLKESEKYFVKIHQQVVQLTGSEKAE